MTTTYVESPEPVRNGLALLVGTRKGAWILTGDERRAQWKAAGPMFLGHIAQHLVLDPRDRTTLLLGASTEQPTPDQQHARVTKAKPVERNKGPPTTGY